MHRIPHFDKIRRSFSSKTQTWSEFNTNQEENSGNKVILKQSDFDTGTIRIKSPCSLSLSEDISFNPNRGFGYKTAPELKGLSSGNNWFPTREQLKKDYDKHAYRLGFFAAITIETSNVILDLNGYTLEQSEEHRLMQRFFAVIELADQPFLPLTGPSNFGDSLDSGSNIIICNGTIGLSSHHGIHGNNNKDVLLQSLSFRDYEVAAVAMNGAERVIMDKIKLLGNNTNVPVLGTFSSLRFIDQFTIETLKHNKNKELSDKLKISKLVQQQIYYKIIMKGERLRCITPRMYKYIESFINDDGLVDGNSYGLLFNEPSVAVNEFSESIKEYKSNDIFLRNIEINNTTGKIKEIVVLNHIVNGELKPIVDTAGSVLQIDKIIDRDGCYKYSILSDYKLTLSKIANTLDKKHYGTLYIPNELYEWSKSDLPITEFITYGSENGNYMRTRNSDTMNHMNKGVNAIRVDGINKLSIENVKITNTTNRGEHGIYDVEYRSSKDGGHFAQSGIEPNLGYMGADVRAIGLFSVSNFLLKNITIDGVTSYNGKSLGIDIQGTSEGINNLNDIDINNTLASSNYSKNTNRSFSCGIRIGYNVVARLHNTKVDNTNKIGDSLYIINNNMSIITNDENILTDKSSIIKKKSDFIFFFIIFLLYATSIIFILLTFKNNNYVIYPLEVFWLLLIIILLFYTIYEISKC